MTTALLYVTLSTALYYLAARAKVTEWLWSRYPPWLESFLLCPACVGYWIGIGLAATIGYHYDLSFLGLDGRGPLAVIVAGLCCMIWTPILAVHMVRSWMDLSETEAETNSDTDGIDFPPSGAA